MKTRYSNSLIPELALFILFSSVSLVVFPQEKSTCAVNLQNAQTLFDNGQVEQVPEMLRECLKSGFKQEEELAAYKLIIQTYLFEDKNEKADSAMLAFLKKYPEYQLSPTDHSSFVHLYNNFDVRPVVQLVFHIGTNIPFVTFIDDPKSISSDPVPGNYSSEALNLFASLEAKFAINSRLELNIEGGFSQSSFSVKKDILGSGVSFYNEIQQRLEIPITATYNFITFGKFTAYARAGAGAAIGLASTAKEVSFLPVVGKDQIGYEISRKNSRIKLDIFGQAGAGIKLKTPRGYINFEIRSNMGVYNQVIRGGDDAIPLAWEYKYSDEDFNLNNLNFSLGYTQIFYKPLKRK
ncbi:MAG: hypothetical protein NTW82_10080 [Bacteroidia bacterium]|nr:hypothetical protein [Bacteroidia bacterium]